jgi:adenylosuccinate synthase
MHKEVVLRAYSNLSENSEPDIYSKPFIDNPFLKRGKRKNSVYIGDTAFGDSGKGIVTAEFNRMFVEQFGTVYSIRFNGGANAGHHMFIDGVEFLANQLPTAVAQKGAVGIITRGEYFHPGDGRLEIERTKQAFGGEMPGSLIIDERAPLVMDTDRALDVMKGSTGRGMGPAAANFDMRCDLTLKDLMADNWGELFKEHYTWKQAVIEATFKDLIEEKRKEVRDFGAKDFLIKRLDNSQQKLGTREDFLSRLAEDREYLNDYVVSSVKDMLQEKWKDQKIPFTIEEAQGPGLDPYFGIRPDVSSTRPTSRNVHDGTYGVIYGKDIALKLGVSKTVYMSSVGARWLPGEMPEDEASFFHNDFGEFGKTTGRKRGIYYLSLPILRALRKFANYDYLVATHIDAATNNPISLISHYTNINTGWEGDYSPYQDEINQLKAYYIEMPGWDGLRISEAKKPSDLDLNARRYLSLLSQTVAPVIMARNGKKLGNNIKWWKD